MRKTKTNLSLISGKRSMAALHIGETPVLSLSSGKRLVAAVQRTKLTSARQEKLTQASKTAFQAYQKPLPHRAK